MILSRTVLLLLGAALVACRPEKEPDPEAAPLMTFDTARVRIVSRSDTIPVLVELARTPEQKTMGLMERGQLADGSGMLFLYAADQPGTAGFWMFRTKIPLDIAFLDSAGVIQSIRNMVPCTTATAAQCPTYTPDVPYRAALEMSEGFFQRRQVRLGDRVLLGDTVRAR
ncbi:MAG TPA: DUF192 domain-containing protein [Gemmatimonadaceae bacterium]|nr:DUF192 domain-containing protein [Gemmatimonadaceae bacterium]